MAPRRILILKPSSLGDVIQALPVLRLLRLHLPSAHIAWWLDSSLAPLLEGDPDLSELIRFPRQAMRGGKGWIEFVRSILRMREQRFDWVIDLQGLARSGAVGWLANGSFTIGVHDPREGAAGFYDQSVARPSPVTHAVDWYLEVLRALQIPVHRNFSWLPLRPEIAAQVRRKWPIDERRWICVQPGARWWNKRWPVEHYEQVIRVLSEMRSDLGFAILGGADDRDLGARLAAVNPDRCVDLTGQASLVEMIEWLRASEMMLTNDTGPMHAAAALGKSVIGLFGPTDPQRTGPYGQQDLSVRLGLDCSPCLEQRCRHEPILECLRGIAPAQIVAEVQRRLIAKPYPAGSLRH